VDFPTLVVNVNLPGASPETMATSVATPLEYQFAEIPGLSQMTSTNILGNSTVTLQFDLDRNIDAAAQDVQSAIDAAGGSCRKTCPRRHRYRKVNPADSAVPDPGSAFRRAAADHRSMTMRRTSSRNRSRR